RPERVILRQRLTREHVERGAGDATGLDRRDQVGLHEMIAAADIDHPRALGQHLEERPRQDASRLRRERQQANHDISLARELLEPVSAGEAGNALDALGRARPATHAEAEISYGARHRAAELSDTHDTDVDRTLGGWNVVDPFLQRLILGVHVELAV